MRRRNGVGGEYVVKEFGEGEQWREVTYKGSRGRSRIGIGKG
jgi:hypothetical protein